MSDARVIIPRIFKFTVLKRRLKRHGIYWLARKGKGGHGSFVGADKDGEQQAFSLPTSQHREVRRTYLKALCRRFDFTNQQIKDIFE